MHYSIEFLISLTRYKKSLKLKGTRFPLQYKSPKHPLRAAPFFIWNRLRF